MAESGGGGVNVHSPNGPRREVTGAMEGGLSERDRVWNAGVRLVEVTGTSNRVVYIKGLVIGQVKRRYHTGLSEAAFL